MSDEGRYYVKQFSPYTDTTFWLHYVLGDLANYDHGYEIWMTNGAIRDQWPALSERAVRLGRKRLLEDGFLVLERKQVQHHPAVYRFVFLDVEPNGSAILGRRRSLDLEPRPCNIDTPESDSRGRGSDAQGSHIRGPGVADPPAAPITNQMEPNQPNLTTADAALFPLESVPAADPINELNTLLADRVEAHRGLRPEITKQWRIDMDRLMRLGPKGIAGKPSLTPDRVAKMINGIFAILAEPERGSTFCWADQVRSPGALRDHWDACHQAGRRRINQAAADPLASRTEVERSLLGNADPLLPRGTK